MKTCIGRVVKSIAGHDTNKFYVVVKVFDEKNVCFCNLVDGKHHKLTNPKKKNILHLAKTNTVISEEYLITNRKIRRVLWQFNNANMGGQKFV